LTDQARPKGRKLSHEIVGLLLISLVISIFLFQILFMCSVMMVESYCAAQNVVLTDEQLMKLDGGVFNLSLLLSVVFFVLLFLFLLGERLSYIRDIIKGINALQSDSSDYALPLEGNNELTRLAEAINNLSAAQKALRAQERRLSEEREQLIHTLSHDIRTPLTSILSYSEFLAERENISPREHREYLALIQTKAEQIKHLTNILLEGGKRTPELFEDARLLMEQLAEEAMEMLDPHYSLDLDLSKLPSFQGSFDVQEMRRIFDNLVSNINKYADPEKPISLAIRLEERQLVIRQTNRCRPTRSDHDSHGLGIISIRRIAHSYGGRVEVHTNGRDFSITILLSEF